MIVNILKWLGYTTLGVAVLYAVFWTLGYAVSLIVKTQ
jgi:hypothetical protein